MSVAAVGLCVLGVAFSSTQTAAASEYETEVPCVAGLHSVTASVAGVPARPDVRRPAPVGDAAPARKLEQTALSVTWTWVDTDPSSARRSHEIDILDAAGEVVSDHRAGGAVRPRTAVLDPLTDHAVRPRSAGGPGWMVESQSRLRRHHGRVVHREPGGLGRRGSGLTCVTAPRYGDAHGSSPSRAGAPRHGRDPELARRPPDRVTAAAIGLPQPGVAAPDVLPQAVAVAEALTTVEAHDVAVVRGQARVTVRFQADDDQIARRVGWAVLARLDAARGHQRHAA